MRQRRGNKFQLLSHTNEANLTLDNSILRMRFFGKRPQRQVLIAPTFLVQPHGSPFAGAWELKEDKASTPQWEERSVQILHHAYLLFEGK